MRTVVSVRAWDEHEPDFVQSDDLLTPPTGLSAAWRTSAAYRSLYALRRPVGDPGNAQHMSHRGIVHAATPHRAAMCRQSLEQRCTAAMKESKKRR